MFYYAQVDEEGICVAISQLPGEVVSDSLILLAQYDLALLGKKYKDGIWEEVEQSNPTEPPLSEAEQLQLETALNVEYLICLTELNG